MRWIVVAMAALLAVCVVLVARQPAGAVPSPCKECRQRFCCSGSLYGWKHCRNGLIRADLGECSWCEATGGMCPDEVVL